METNNKATSFYSGNIYMPTCVECKKKFLSPEAFEKHKASFKFKCQYCGVTFERAENQLNHVETHMISCFSCPKKFPNESQLKNHVNNLHRFACPECSEDCGSESNLGKHTVKKHMFPCQQCKETLKTEEAYQAHMQNFHGTEASKVPSHDNIVGPSENQGTKEDMVKVQKFSQCVECKQMFKSEKELESHILILHNNIGEDSSARNVSNTDGKSENPLPGTQDNSKISCQFCNKEFTDFDVWKKHEEEESMVDIGSSIVDVATNEEMDMSEFFLPNTDGSQNNSKDQVISGEQKEVDENNTRFHDDSQWERVKHFYVEEKTVTARKLETTYRELQRINNLQVKKLEATDLKNLPIAKRSYKDSQKTKTSKGDEEISNYKKMKYQLPNFAHLGVTIAKSVPNEQKALSSSGSDNQESAENTPENLKTKENENENTQENVALLKAVKKIEDKESSILEDADDIIDNDLDTAEADAFNEEELKEAEKELRRKWMYKMRTKVRCDECKKIVSEYRLEYHKKFHTDRVYRCCICSQGFLSRKQLSTHKYKKYLWTNSHKTVYFKKEKIRSKMDTFTMKIINYPQHKVLVSHFKTFPFLTKKKADEISEQTELPLKAIQIWFQNRRLKNNVSEDAWKDMIASQPPSAAPNGAGVATDKIDKINQLIGSTPKAAPPKQKKPAINYKNYKGATTGKQNIVPLKTSRGPTNQSNSIRPNLGPLNQVNYLNQINPANYQAGLNPGAFLNQGSLPNQVPIKQEISVKQETIDVDNYQGPQRMQAPMMQGANGAMMQVPMMQGPMMQGVPGARMQMPMMQGAPGSRMQMQGALINPGPVKQETIDVDNYAVGTDYDLLIAARFNALQRTYQSLFKTFTDLKSAPLVGDPNTSQNPANLRPIITYNNPSMLAGNNPPGAPINNPQLSGNPTILSQRPVKMMTPGNPITKQPNQKYLVPVRVQGNPGLPINAQGINMQNLTSRPINMPNNMASNSMNLASRSGNMPNNIGSLPGNMPNGIQFRARNMPNNMTSMPGNMPNNITGNMSNNMTSMPGNMPNNISSRNGNMPSNIPPSLPSFLRQSNAPNGGPKMNGRNVQLNTSVEKNLASNGFGNGQQQFTKSYLSNLDKINGTNPFNPQQQQQQNNRQQHNNQQQQQNNLRNLQRINIVPKTINVMSNHPKVEIYKKNIIPS